MNRKVAKEFFGPVKEITQELEFQENPEKCLTWTKQDIR
jgi:hypothetical protein